MSPTEATPRAPPKPLHFLLLACFILHYLPGPACACLCGACLLVILGVFLRMSSIGGIRPVGAPSGQPASTRGQILPPPLLAVCL